MRERGTGQLVGERKRWFVKGNREYTDGRGGREVDDSYRGDTETGGNRQRDG